MNRTLTAVAVTAALVSGAQLLGGAAASAVPQPQFVDGPSLGSSDVGCGALGCTNPLVEFLLIDMLDLLNSQSGRP
ncbi:hypothetical protein [Nocardia asteroides]|uniref:hypothetical protein n=1 Tax=Nocardia asteroides TaxID=1824 RepID=UPI001E4679CE|nr:hypothetical protein [Nocardia asteroides]UGT55940.1 hypothetical protein LTT85_03375 [Nocardia asteroides]